VGAGADLAEVSLAGWVAGGWVVVTARALAAVAQPWQVVGAPW
jgi:hypothetical protein